MRKDGDALVIGAMTRHADVASSADVKRTIPALAALAEGIGDRQVRNMGTLGGSLANNDPAADWPAAVLALNATVHHEQAQNRRRPSFFKGMYETALAADEIITGVSFPGAAESRIRRSSRIPRRASRWSACSSPSSRTAAYASR